MRVDHPISGFDKKQIRALHSQLETPVTPLLAKESGRRATHLPGLRKGLDDWAIARSIDDQRADSRTVNPE